jgi:hypothetical protein
MGKRGFLTDGVMMIVHAQLFDVDFIRPDKSCESSYGRLLIAEVRVDVENEICLHLHLHLPNCA